MSSIFELQSVLFGLTLVLLLKEVRTAIVPAPINYDTVPLTHSGHRNTTVDVLRGIAIVAVILIHCTHFMVESGIWTTWHTYMNNGLRFAIPVFLTTSGLLLAPVGWCPYFYFHFLRARVTALLIPYLLVAILVVSIHGSSQSGLVYDVLSGTAALPFYFVIILMQLYLVYPLIAPLATRPWFVWLTLVLSIVAALTESLSIIGGVILAVPYVFYFVWGIYMRPYLLNEQPLATIPAWPWVALITVYIGAQFTIPPTFFYNCQYLFGIAFVCLSFKYLSQVSATWRLFRYLANIGTISLWIFLTHFTFMEFVLPHVMPLVYESTFIGLVAWYAVSVIGSIALGWLCARLFQVVGRVFKRNVGAAH